MVCVAPDFSCTRLLDGLGVLESIALLAVLWRCAGAIALCNPLGDLVVPLLLGPAIQKTNNDHGHVVTANATPFTVRGETVVHHVFANLREFLFGGNASPDKLDNCLR